MKFTTGIKTLGGNLFSTRPRGSSVASSKTTTSSDKNEKKQTKVTLQAPAAERPRVSFRDSDELLVEHPVESNVEYDRTAVDDHIHDPSKNDIYDELISFCECEMPVHKQSRGSVKHGFLHGDVSLAKMHVRRRCQDANRKLGKRDSNFVTAPSKQRQQIMTGF